MGKNLNVNKLRRDLMDYFGTAMNSGFPMAMVDLGKIQRASTNELIKIAEKNGIDI